MSTSRASDSLRQCLILLLNLTLHHFNDTNPYSKGYNSLPNYGARNIDYDTDPNNQCTKSLELLFESLKTPAKEGPTNELSRLDNNTLTYLSPATKHLQQDIAGNSAQKISLNTSKMLRELRKSILYNIDWMIQDGMIEENAEAAEIFHEMEKYVQKCKLKLQETILLEKNKGRQLGKLEFVSM